MTTQEMIKSQLEQSGIAYKEVKCYGSQIMVTAWSQDAATKWAMLLQKFATVRSTVKTIDETKTNNGSSLIPTVVNVWRVWATI